ncbi:MAG: dihydrodipicolinate synthase family protein, partial [Alphaproteobacteria bacterium]
MAALRTDWKGVFTPIVTPFAADGTLDEDKTRALVELLIGEGVHGVIAAGSTGEWFSLSDGERLRLFAVVKEQVAGRLPVIGGTSAIGTREAVGLTSAARDMGLNGCMVLPPPYAMPSRRGVVQFF